MKLLLLASVLISSVVAAQTGTYESKTEKDGKTTLILTPAPAVPPKQPPEAVKPPTSMLFWSGFESGVLLSAVKDCYDAGCWQDILGTDAETGFSWPPKIAGGTSTFQVRAGTNTKPTVATINSFMTNEIVTITGRTGKPTRALHQLTKRQCVGTGTINTGGNCSTQDAYLVRPTREPGDMYISFWRRLDPALEQKLINGWHVIFEVKTTGDYRFGTQLVNYGGKPIWMSHADNVANGGLPRQEFWRVSNTTVPVPKYGEWFKYEVFWHRSKGNDGRIWMAINGSVIADKSGPNIGVNNNYPDRIMPIQHYTAATYPTEQWTDDLQIWSTFPTAKQGDPWFDGVYAPH